MSSNCQIHGVRAREHLNTTREREKKESHTYLIERKHIAGSNSSKMFNKYINDGLNRKQLDSGSLARSRRAITAIINAFAVVTVALAVVVSSSPSFQMKIVKSE